LLTVSLTVVDRVGLAFMSKMVLHLPATVSRFDSLLMRKALVNLLRRFSLSEWAKGSACRKEIAK